MTLPIAPPWPPMLALLVAEMPTGPEWLYEPKWDGFRCLAFRDGGGVELQSKSCQSLTRYFPEIAAAVASLPVRRLVLDGELVVPVDGSLSFDDLLQRAVRSRSGAGGWNGSRALIFAGLRDCGSLR